MRYRVCGFVAHAGCIDSGSDLIPMKNEPPMKLSKRLEGILEISIEYPELEN